MQPHSEKILIFLTLRLWIRYLAYCSLCLKMIAHSTKTPNRCTIFRIILLNEIIIMTRSRVPNLFGSRLSCILSSIKYAPQFSPDARGRRREADRNAVLSNTRKNYRTLPSDPNLAGRRQVVLQDWWYLCQKNRGKFGFSSLQWQCVVAEFSLKIPKFWAGNTISRGKSSNLHTTRQY